jgi:hypothetical protein
LHNRGTTDLNPHSLAAVVQLVPAQHLHQARCALGILLAVLGIVVTACEYARWAGCLGLAAAIESVAP